MRCFLHQCYYYYHQHHQSIHQSLINTTTMSKATSSASTSNSSSTTASPTFTLCTPENCIAAFSQDHIEHWARIAAVAETVKADVFHIFLESLVNESLISVHDGLYLAQFYGYMGKAATLNVLKSGIRADFKPKASSTNRGRGNRRGHQQRRGQDRPFPSS